MRLFGWRKTGLLLVGLALLAVAGGQQIGLAADVVKYEQGFESAVSGVEPSNGSVGLSSIQDRSAYSGNSVVVATYQDQGSAIKALVISAGPDAVNGYTYISKKFFPENGTIFPHLTHFELRLRADSTLGELVFTGKGNNAGAGWSQFLKLNNGTMYFLGEQVTTYTADRWYSIRMDIDPELQTGSIAVDGDTMLQDVVMTAANIDMVGTSATEFEVRLMNNNKGTSPVPITFALDQIRVSVTPPERTFEVTAAQIEQKLDGLSHPYLIVKADQFADWRAKAAVPGSPWEGMKQDAIQDALNLQYTYRQQGTGAPYTTAPGVPQVTSVTQMNSASLVNGAIVSSAVLAYILDPDNKQQYVDKVERMLDDYYTYVYPYLGTDGSLSFQGRGVWDTQVTPSSAFFNLVVALDVMHDDFQAAGKLAAAESKLQAAADWFRDPQKTRTFDWKAGLYGARGIWSLYTKEASDAAVAIQDYKDYHNGAVEPDGVFLGGSYYAAERYGGAPAKRDSKIYFMDLLESLDMANFYGDAKWQSFYEWVYGYAFSPVTRLSPNGQTAKKDYFIFGDTEIKGTTWNETLSNNYTAANATMYKTHLFTDKAFQYAGAAAGNPNAPVGRIWHYYAYKEPFPAPAPIPSRIFPSGNAVFYEPWTQASDANRILAGSFWSPTSLNSNAGHARFDVNAIHLTGYGEHLLRGAGYPGYTPMMAQPDYYLNAASHNTVTINGQNHTRKYGAGFDPAHAGVPEAFADDKFGYASGHSGTALPNGTHVRNFVQVNGQDGAGGYWLLLDEVQASAGDTANVMLHPSSDSVTEAVYRTEYVSRSSYRKAIAASAVDLTVFFATEPEQVELKQGVFAAINETAEPAQYIKADFAVDGQGKKHIATVLFPHDAAHPKATMTRSSGVYHTGAEIAQSSSITDYGWESDGQHTVTRGSASFSGLGGLYRLIGNDTAFYFVRQGNAFRSAASGGAGFEATQPVTVYMRGASGHIVAQHQTSVKLYDPLVQSVKLNGAAVAATGSGTGWVQIDVPAGTYRLELVY